MWYKFSDLDNLIDVLVIYVFKIGLQLIRIL